jgi:hypothetical protein
VERWKELDLKRDLGLAFGATMARSRKSDFKRGRDEEAPYTNDLPHPKVLFQNDSCGPPVKKKRKERCFYLDCDKPLNSENKAARVPPEPNPLPAGASEKRTRTYARSKKLRFCFLDCLGQKSNCPLVDMRICATHMSKEPVSKPVKYTYKGKNKTFTE